MDMLETAKTLGEMDIQAVKIHLLYVIRGTRLHEMYRAGRYTCLDRQEYVERVCDFLERLPEKMIVQRLTGDPHRDELVAPDWSLDKTKTLSLIRSTLEARDSRQGMRARAARGGRPDKGRN